MSTPTVAFPEGTTGSSLLYRLLAQAVDSFPEAFQALDWPSSANAFRASFAEHVVQFEAARVNSIDRSKIATFLADELVECMSFGEQPLTEALAIGASAPSSAISWRSGAKAGWTPLVPFEGEVFEGQGIASLIDRLCEEHKITDAAANGLRWVLRRLEHSGGALDLSGERFVILGAGAEIAPTEWLLRAGARVLWVDVAQPEKRLPLEELAGELTVVPGASDILTQGPTIVQAIREFCADGPAHFGLFAYAAGKGRELRLAAAMDAIVRAVPLQLVASIGTYVSPTTPASVQIEDQSAAVERLERSRWRSALGRVGLLSGPGHYRNGDQPVPIARAIVSLQGPGYLAAQYIAKMLMAERWATLPEPPTVSANVAGITNTRSLEHPVFQVAFAGANAVQMQIFDTETTRVMSALLWLHDLLNPEAPAHAQRVHSSANERAACLLSQQIHGGVYANPWEFESVIRTALVIGFVKQPWRAFRSARS